MNYEEEFFKQMVFKNNKSYNGFSFIVTLIMLTCLGLYFLVKRIIKMVQTKDDRKIQREAHSRAVTKLIKILGATNYTLHYNVLESHIHPSTGDLTQKVNFMAFNEDTRSIDIINVLVNEVLYGTLEVSKGKNRDTTGSIILHSNELDRVMQDLQDVTSSAITFRMI